MGKNQKIKGNNGILYFITRGLFLTGVLLLFDMLALIIFSVNSPVLQFIISLITLAPLIYIILISGKMAGEHTFKAAKRNKVIIKQGEYITNSQKFLNYHWAKGLIVGAIFALPQIIILTLGLILKNIILCAIIKLYNMSFYGMLISLGLIGETAGPINALLFIIIFAIPIVYEVGFVMRAKKLQKQQMEIENEIRLFNI